MEGPMPILFEKLKKKRKTRTTREPHLTLKEIFSGRRRNEIKGIACWALSVLLIAAFWPHQADQNLIGPLGEIIYRLAFALVGVMLYLLPAALVAAGWMIFRQKEMEHKSFKVLGWVLGFLSLGILIELIYPHDIVFKQVPSFYYWHGAAAFWKKMPALLHLWTTVALPAGGLVADSMTRVLQSLFATVGTTIISGVVLVLALYLLELETYVLRGLRRFRDRMSAALSQAKTASLKGFDYARPPVAEVKKNEKRGTVKKAQVQSLPETPEPRPKIKINALPGPGSSKIPATLPETPAPQAVTAAQREAMSVATEDKPYQLPGLELLEDPRPNPALTTAYFENMSNTLEQALAQFGVAAKVVEVCPGPVVTRYELQPSPGVKINRIISLSDDIALTMRAAHVRIEAPIPGKGAVGIEVPNQEKQIVVIKELLASQKCQDQQSLLTFAVGKDIGGELIFGELNSMPHLLIAGATGSGKSACMNGIISSILYRAKPDQVKLLMIDPKRVELTVYNGIPHLISPVITDSREAAGALRLLVREMEERYKRLAELGVRDITGYNQKVQEEQAAWQTQDQQGEEVSRPVLNSMPFILIFIDELADLMMVAANEVENTLARLAQMARAVGIHMVLATQRPSVDVITGVIKANFPSRIAFQVSSKVDSRTILDANGADALLGKGDMLYSLASLNKPLRVQGVFITTKEVERVVRFWKKQGQPVFDESFSQEKLKTLANGNGGGTGQGGEDDLYQQAVAWVVRAKQASTSMLQRRLKIGYSRAARLLDLMEENGIVGPPEGSKPRKVLVEEDQDMTSNALEGRSM